MEKTIGKEYKNQREREAFLKDNCDNVEEKGYMKSYSPEELQGHKENLANLSIEISEIEEEKKLQDAHFKGQLKPLKEQRQQMVSNIKSKAEYVKEVCFILLSPGANQTLEEVRDRAINEQLDNIKLIAPKIAIIEV